MTRLSVNGNPLDFQLDPQVPLLWALRDGANLTDTKYACGTGECGACMVLVDGTVKPSCTLSLGECEGRAITTVEGLSAPSLHPVQEALLAEGAIQCGFCTPGIVVAAAALLSRNAAPGEDEIKAALTNLCRCGVYPRLARAVQRAGAAMRGTVAPVSAPPAPPLRT